MICVNGWGRGDTPPLPNGKDAKNGTHKSHHSHTSQLRAANRGRPLKACSPSYLLLARLTLTLGCEICRPGERTHSVGRPSPCAPSSASRLRRASSSDFVCNEWRI